MKKIWIYLLVAVWILLAAPVNAAEPPTDQVTARADSFFAPEGDGGVVFRSHAAGFLPPDHGSADPQSVLTVLFAVIVPVLFILIVLIALNIHNYKKKEAIREDMNCFYQILNTYINTDEYIFYLKDENLKYIFANSSLGKLHNKKAADIIGLDDYALSNEETASKRRFPDLQVLEKNAPISYELYQGGAYYKVAKFPVTLRNGKTGVGAVIQDVTEEKTKLKTLELILHRHRIILDVVSLSFQNTREQLDYVLNQLVSLTESQYGCIFLYHEETEKPIEYFWSDQVSENCSLSEKEICSALDKSGVWSESIRQRKPFFLNRFDRPHPLKKGYPTGHIPLSSFLSVPIIAEEKIVAVLGLANKKTDYTEDDANEISLIMTTVWNAAKRREAQDKLFYERNKYLQTLESIGDGVLVANRSGTVEMLNNVAERLTGWTFPDARGKHYSDIFRLSHRHGGIPPNDPVKAVLESNRPYEESSDSVLIAKNGARRDVEDNASPIKDDKGNLQGVVLVFRDVTDKRERLKKIAFLSYHDSLTGLFNRSFVEEELQRIDLENTLPVTVVIGDVNGLKLTNDIFGHQHGDDLLRRIARVMRQCFRDTDLLARWGGDEFVVLLPHTEQEEAERIIDAVKERFSKERIKAMQGSISMGAFTIRSASESVWDALVRAEERMYRAKAVDRAYMESDVLHSLVRFLHESSPREKEHAEAVGRLCVRMGKRMQLSEIEIKKLKEAGYLHDIGKIALDPVLLNHRFQKTDKEWNEVKKHPVIGYRILNFFDNTVDLAQIVLDHQERWDGSGYPKGLKREEIPLLSRIISIAESYERSISGSDNQEPLSRHDALARLQNNAGRHFDPCLVDIFLAMLREDENKNMDKDRDEEA